MFGDRRVAAIILAGGAARRFGGATRKQFAPLLGKSLLAHSLAAFGALEQVDRVAIVAAADDRERASGAVAQSGLNKPFVIVEGGARRQDSARRGLAALAADMRANDIALIHDAARPLVGADLILRTLTAAAESGAAVPVIPCGDTVKRVDADGAIAATVSRAPQPLYLAQTPQAFRWELINRAHAAVGADASDDAALVEAAGVAPQAVAGDPRNIKITYQTDWDLAATFAADAALESAPNSRRGVGYDAHRLAAPGPLRIGGVEIPFELGLEGHSDGDVLLHALADALLGAGGLGDLGVHFPPTAEWKGDSAKIVKSCLAKLAAKKLRLRYADAVVIAQKPHLRPSVPAIKRSLASILNLNEDMINIKATTTDFMGVIGQGAGIAAQAIVTIAGHSDETV